MTVSIHTQLWGMAYVQFIPRWWESIRKLNRQPDEIVLCATDEVGLLDSVPDWVQCPVVKVLGNCKFGNEWGKLSMSHCTSEWISYMAIDDQYSPTAFDPIDEADGDLIIDKIQMSNGILWPAIWDTENTDSRGFAPGGVAIFRRNLIELWEQIPDEIIWNDYYFYLLCVKNNVKVFLTDNLRMYFDVGADRETTSGLRANPERVRLADEQIKIFKESLS